MRAIKENMKRLEKERIHDACDEGYMNAFIHSLKLY